MFSNKMRTRSGAPWGSSPPRGPREPSERRDLGKSAKEVRKIESVCSQAFLQLIQSSAFCNKISMRLVGPRGPGGSPLKAKTCENACSYSQNVNRQSTFDTVYCFGRQSRKCLCAPDCSHQSIFGTASFSGRESWKACGCKMVASKAFWTYILVLGVDHGRLVGAKW